MTVDGKFRTAKENEVIGNTETIEFQKTGFDIYGLDYLISLINTNKHIFR